MLTPFVPIGSSRADHSLRPKVPIGSPREIDSKSFGTRNGADQDRNFGKGQVIPLIWCRNSCGYVYWNPDYHFQIFFFQLNASTLIRAWNTDSELIDSRECSVMPEKCKVIDYHSRVSSRKPPGSFHGALSLSDG